LTVTGFDQNGDASPSHSLTFTPQVEAYGLLDCTFPEPNQDITEWKDDFFPQGDTDHDLSELWMYEESDPSTHIGYFDHFVDPYVYQIWYGEFVSLTSGTYTLHAKSTSGDTIDIPGLTVA
jgi:hypothetical protein